MRRRDELSREFTVILPRDVYILLSQLQCARVEQDYRPSAATRSAIICDAIREMGKRELPHSPSSHPGKVTKLSTVKPPSAPALPDDEAGLG